MLNKLRSFVREYQLLQPGDRVVCAVSGGADSVALLFSLYLLREQLGITLVAAHYNHGLRGEESDRDEQFVRQLCDRFDIPLSVGQGKVTPGKKGLEAAARDARYGYLKTLDGKIATAHTADDNAETVLMHMVRGTGLKGLGGIAPINGRLIRPMLSVTRQDVLAFLQEYSMSWVTDSSNETDQFLRNRLRGRVMPLLKQENPRLAEKLSAMALRLREDENALWEMAVAEESPDVPALRRMPTALRSRWIADFLQKNGVKEPEAEHIALTESLIFSCKPSAKIILRDGIQISRSYDRLLCSAAEEKLVPAELFCPGEIQLKTAGWNVYCSPATGWVNESLRFTVRPVGRIYVRGRCSGDALRLSGGTKTLKKLFIDRKIPAVQRNMIPVIVDDLGVLGVCGVGGNLDRLDFGAGAVEIRFEPVL